MLRRIRMESGTWKRAERPARRAFVGGMPFIEEPEHERRSSFGAFVVGAIVVLFLVAVIIGSCHV
jgi:hypothetical protein